MALDTNCRIHIIITNMVSCGYGSNNKERKDEKLGAFLLREKVERY
jgi:hypothetical protein